MSLNPKKTLIPRTVVVLSRLRGPGRWRAGLRRLFGGRGHVELYFAFDDPYAAVALPPLLSIVQRHKAELVLFPLIERGIEGDPALAQRRQHAITDSQRLARRQGLILKRREVLDANETRFLAGWLESARGQPGANAFAAAAITQLWLNSTGPVRQADYAELYERHLGRNVPAEAAPVRDHFQRLRRKGHWESPAAWVDGEWFFAHERLGQIEDRLNDLGW